MPLVNQEAERIVKGMKKNSHRFKDLYGKRDKEVMYATANKLAQKKQVKQKTWKSGQGFAEANKSGDNSLRDWFKKSKSSDGKPGWVQLGGKYAGKPCARQPGQTTKPKCGSSKMKRNLNKDEEEAAFRRKQKEDPNPDRKGKAINVKTEETINEKAPKYDKQGLDKFDRSKRMIRHMQDKYGSAKSGFGPDSKFRTGKDHSVANEKKAKMKEEVIAERGDFWHPDPDKDRKLGGPGANQRAREDRGASRSSSSSSVSGKPKLKPGESYMQYAKRVKSMKTRKEEVEIEEGKKDACYHKVKSRYSVWPSAYASGALVKCRKKGAKNWGNKSKKEEFEGNLSFQDFQEKAQSCWKSHKKVGMKMKGGKLVNDCRPKNEEVTNEGMKCWKGYEKKGTQKLFGKKYNRCVKKEETQNEAAAWTRKAGKNKEGGLNEKGRKSYERENPGSDLKAPSKKVGNPRRASFCARMKGMKAKLTSKKTASDPDSRINKSLRAWNC